MFHIGIIGAGQIGSRHLQAMANFDQPAQLWIVDPSPASLQTARERFAECAPNASLTAVRYLTAIDQLPASLDLVIVATSADVRRAVVEALLAHASPRFLILEKVLFQSTDDLDAIGRLLRERGVPTWVNCPFRMIPYYHELRDRFAGNTGVEFNVSGGLFGLGCNTIHFLDLCAWLTGDSGFELSAAMLDPGVIPSKRAGFVEFTGTVAGRASGGTRFSATSHRTGDAPVVISLSSATVRCVIRQSDGTCWTSDAASGWTWREESFVLPYQSQLSHVAVREILSTGTCALTTYDESAALHRSLLTALLTHLRDGGLAAGDRCPIT